MSNIEIEKKDRMRKFLIECAIKGTTPNYRVLALNSRFRWLGTEERFGPDFLTTLKEIGNEDVDAGRPPLNGLVRKGEFPEIGFYYWYVEKFPKIKVRDIIDNKAFDQKLRADCSEYWRHSAEGLASRSPKVNNQEDRIACFLINCVCTVICFYARV